MRGNKILSIKQKVSIMTIHIINRNRLIDTGDFLTQVNVDSNLYIKIKRSMKEIVPCIQEFYDYFSKQNVVLGRKLSAHRGYCNSRWQIHLKKKKKKERKKKKKKRGGFSWKMKFVSHKESDKNINMDYFKVEYWPTFFRIGVNHFYEWITYRVT